MPIYVICIEDMAKGILLVLFCKRDMIFFSETYIHIGPIALQTSLFILQEKTQSIKNTTKLISNKLNIIKIFKSTGNTLYQLLLKFRSGAV